MISLRRRVARKVAPPCIPAIMMLLASARRGEGWSSRSLDHRRFWRGIAIRRPKARADPTRVRDALVGGFASPKILEVHGERMIKRNFEPGFRIELHRKDLNPRARRRTQTESVVT
jgi:hypothetical protein